MQSWQLQTAKNRFSEVVDRAIDQGPQVITRRGSDAVVVISIEEYRRLRRPAKDLVEFFRSSPLAAARAEDEDLDFERDTDSGREVEL